MSNKDVQNYHQIDRDLFILKNLTEKSELWVHHLGGPGGSGMATNCSSPSNPSQDRSRSMSGDELMLLEWVKFGVGAFTKFMENLTKIGTNKLASI